MKSARRRIQEWRAGWRDTLILMKKFRSPLILFTVAVIGGGFIYKVIANAVGEPIESLSESIYVVLTAAFLQPVGEFPKYFGLQIFHFLMPLIGVVILAQGLADFGSLLFNRRARNKEWEMAVASTMNKHIVLIGLGHLGFRIVQRLHEMGENVVAIELNPGSHTTIAPVTWAFRLSKAMPATIAPSKVPIFSRHGPSFWPASMMR